MFVKTQRALIRPLPFQAHDDQRMPVAVNSVHLPPIRAPMRDDFANVLIQNDKATDKSQGRRGDQERNKL